MATDPDSARDTGEDGEATFVSARNQPPPSTEDRRKIFISYKHGEENNFVAGTLQAELSRDYEVFIDRLIAPGERWGDRIDEELRRADVLIALISADAAKEDDVVEELEIARTLQEETGTGKPRIIPVRLWYSEQYGYKLGRLIGPLNYCFLQDLEHLPDLINDLRDAIERRETPAPDAAGAAALARYQLSGFTAGYLLKSFINTPAFARARSESNRGKLVWLTGDAGVRNFVARSLAVQLRGGRVYDIPKSQSWESVSRSRVGGSALVFRDVTSDSHFDDDIAGKELAALSDLLSNDNTVIVTSASDELLEAKQYMRRFEFKSYHWESVSHDLYKVEQKYEIFEKLLEASHLFESISEHQYKLAKALGGKPPEEDGRAATQGRQGGAGDITTLNRSRFQHVLDRWTPEDIERFVIDILPEARTQTGVAKLLQNHATLDEEIHSWFFSLDDSVKCFVLTLAIFPGLSNPRLWNKYRQVFDRLRKLDSKLSLWPLGMCRERAAPHVTIDGSADFTSQRVAEAVRLEVAKNYREFFLQLKQEGLLKKWSVPSEAQAEDADLPPEAWPGPRDLTRDRFSVARMVGEAAKVELSDLITLIEEWADHDDRSIREAVAEAFEATAGDMSAGFKVLKTLGDWCFGAAGAGRAHKRVWAAAMALGRMTAVEPGGPVSARSLAYLERLAVDRRDRVSDFVAEAAKRAARKVPASAIARLLALLAHNQKPYTRINAADALNEARLADDGDEEDAERLFDEWDSSNDSDLCRAAVCSLILQGNQRKWKDGSSEAIQSLEDSVRRVSPIFADAMREAVGDKFYRQNALATLNMLARRSAYGGRSELVLALASSLSQQPDEDFFNLLKASTFPRLQSLTAEVRSELWERFLDSPPDFLVVVDGSLQQPEKFTEAGRALELLSRPEPEGCGWQLTSALASCFTNDHNRLERVLLKFKETKVPASDVPLAVRDMALRALLDDPPTFVAFVYYDLKNFEERVLDTMHVLDSLAHPAPTGYSEALKGVLLRAYPQKPEEVNWLLQRFRSAGSTSLLRVAQAVQPELLENLLSDPLAFLAQITKSMEDEAEWEETLDELQYLASPDSRGKRAMLTETLAKAKLQKIDEVTELLQHISRASREHLDLFFSLRVTLNFYWLKILKILQVKDSGEDDPI